MVNFDNAVDRAGTGSVKWDLRQPVFGSDKLIPLWIADTDFAAPDSVLQTLQEKLAKPALGYGCTPRGLFPAVAGWLQRRHGWDVDPGWICTAAGLVSALAMSICAFSKEGDKVMITTPVYDPFYEIIEKNGRIVEKASLTGSKFGEWKLDLDKIEESFRYGTRMLLWCNPHNPTGRVWTREEMAAVGKLCCQYGVTVISDDIHSDIMIGGSKYTPFGKACPEIMPHLVTCYSTGKTFSLAGLKGAAVVISNPEMRQAFKDYEKRFHMDSPGLLTLAAMTTAYETGDEYVDALNEYLTGNARYVADYIEKKIPALKSYVQEGTFLMLADCSSTGLKSWQLVQHYIDNAEILFSRGAAYGTETESCVRINIGTSRAILQQMLENLEALHNGQPIPHK